MKFNVKKLDALIAEDIADRDNALRLEAEIEELERVLEKKRVELNKTRLKPFLMSKAEMYFSKYAESKWPKHTLATVDSDGK